jgi:hypothetical protein
MVSLAAWVVIESPINPGDPKWTVANIPQVIGGIDAESTKILENTFRNVNYLNIICQV